MQKVLALIGGLLINGALYAEHIHLSSPKKCVCTRKRLEMSKAHLRTTQTELALLEESGNECEPELFESHQSRILQLKDEILELETRIPVIEKSLQALCKTVQ